MKKAIKLLSLAMLFAMPLAACNNNNSGGGSQSGGSESGDSGGGGGQHSGDEGGGSGSGGGGGQHSGDEGGGSGSGGGGGQQASTVVLDFSKIKDVSGKVGSVSYTTDIGSGQSAPAYNDGKQELRLYIGNTITFSGATFTSIEFDANGCGETKATGTLSASTGSLSGFKWTGNASSVKFTVNGGKQVHINSITIKTNGAGGGSGDEGGGGSGGGQVADLEGYAKELSYNVFEEEDGYELLEDGSYYVGVYWEEEGAMSLVEACEDAYNYTPEDFVLADDPEEDGDMAYMICATEDESVYIEIDSYLEDDDDGVTWICIDYFIYEAE